MIFDGTYSGYVSGDASGTESTTNNTRPEFDAFTKSFNKNTGFSGDVYSNKRCGFTNISSNTGIGSARDGSEINIYNAGESCNEVNDSFANESFANESFANESFVNDSFTTANNTFCNDISTVSTISPRLHLSDYQSLSSPPPATKIIINCSTTNKFLEHINSPAVNLSSDIIVLSLDPSYNAAEQPHHIQQYIRALNRTLQNFVSSFYTNNPLVNQLIHELPSNLEITSPILGGNLLTQFFNLTRLIKLISGINSNIETLIVSENESNLATGLAIACLMDTYNYNLNLSYNIIKRERPSVRAINFNFYDDLIVVENLKKYYHENYELKKGKVVLTKNSKLKRKDVDDLEVDAMDMVWEKEQEKRRRF